jgi:hypothetical protein
VNRHDGALHINQIVLTQTASNPFCTDKHCATYVSEVASRKSQVEKRV